METARTRGDTGFLSGWQGRNVCRLKGVCCFWQPTPGKHRPAKPFGKSGLNTFGKGGRKTANVSSRNEFVAEALKFYMGYLLAGKAENYFLQSLTSVLTGTVQDSENRLARMDFKIAVELSKLSQVIAYTHDVDEESLNRLHVKCVDEVRRINGTVKFEDAYHYQKRDV